MTSIEDLTAWCEEHREHELQVALAVFSFLIGECDHSFTDVHGKCELCGHNTIEW